MTYDNLVDFSVHPSDLKRLEGGWKGLKKYIEQSGINTDVIAIDIKRITGKARK